MGIQPDLCRHGSQGRQHLGSSVWQLGSYFISCHISDANGAVLAQCDSRLAGTWLTPDRAHDVTLSIDDLWLRPGRYSVDVFLCSMGVMDAWEGAATFEVLPGLPYPEHTSEEAYAATPVLTDFSYDVS